MCVHLARRRLIRDASDWLDPALGPDSVVLVGHMVVGDIASTPKVSPSLCIVSDAILFSAASTTGGARDLVAAKRDSGSLSGGRTAAPYGVPRARLDRLTL